MVQMTHAPLCAALIRFSRRDTMSSAAPCSRGSRMRRPCATTTPKRAGDVFVTKRLHFGWALHNHQPVGNFPAVFEDIYVRAYEPLVAALERHPTIRLTLHYTGPVLEGLVAQQPTFLERLASCTSAPSRPLPTSGL